MNEFYKKIQSWGAWKPIHHKWVAKDSNFKKNEIFGMNMFNVVIGIVAHITLVIFPMYLVFRQYIYYYSYNLFNIVEEILVE